MGLFLIPTVLCHWGHSANNLKSPLCCNHFGLGCACPHMPSPEILPQFLQKLPNVRVRGNCKGKTILNDLALPLL